MRPCTKPRRCAALVGASLLFLLQSRPADACGCVQLAKITAGQPTGNFGISVSLDGDRALIGANQDREVDVSAGAAYVMVRSAVTGGWALEQKLLASDAASGDFFGMDVALDGETAVIGAIFDADFGTNSGAAYVFVRDAVSGLWSEQQKLTTVGHAAYDLFAESVAIDGDTVIGGAKGDDDAGAAYAFVRTSGVWTEQQRLVGTGTVRRDQFGIDVALDGDRALIGAPNVASFNESNGAAYLFVREPSTGVWSEEQVFRASDGAIGDEFGLRGAIFGDTLVIAAPYDDDGGINSGSVYVWVLDPVSGSWVEQQKLRASDGAAGALFGISPALGDNTLAVGAILDSGAAATAGAAYLFVRDRNGTPTIPTDDFWTEICKLTAADGTSDDQFGGDVSVSGDVTIVGARKDGSGSAYTFQRQPGGPAALGPLTDLRAAKAGGAVRLAWRGNPLAQQAHVNAVAAKVALVPPGPHRTDRAGGVGTAECAAVAPRVTCNDGDALVDLRALLFYQVLAACGPDGVDEGPIE